MKCLLYNREINLPIGGCLLFGNGSLWNFDIYEGHQRKGYGKLLFNSIISYIKEYYQHNAQIHLYCEIDNDNAIKFYKALGLKCDNTIYLIDNRQAYKFTSY